MTSLHHVHIIVTILSDKKHQHHPWVVSVVQELHCYQNFKQRWCRVVVRIGVPTVILRTVGHFPEGCILTT